MANRSLQYIRANQPAYTPAGTDLLVLESGGNSRSATVDELAVLVSGLTTTQSVQSAWRGATVGFSAGFQTFPGIVTWETSIEDTDNFWSGGAQSRLTVPAGVTRVRLKASIISNNGTSTTLIKILKNGNTTPVEQVGPFSNTVLRIPIQTIAIAVTAGDFFEVETTVTGSLLPPSYFNIEVVESLI